MTARKTSQSVVQQPTRAALYLRVSTDEQARDGYGLDVQRTKGNAQAALKDWQIVKEYADEGISGTKGATGRPALAQLLADAAAGVIDAVIVLALDRLGRKTRIVLEVVEQLTAAGVVLASVKEALDTSTPQGGFVLTMFAALAQLERDMIVQRTTDGRNARGAIDGERGGALPYGYARSEDGPVVVDYQAAIVQRILKHKRSGKSYHQIARELNADQVPGPRGGQWYGRSVKIVCDARSVYQGAQRKGSEARWPVLI